MENAVIGRNCRTLHEEIDTQMWHMWRWVNKLERKRRSANPSTHWRASGSQAALERVARHMKRMRTCHISSFMLYKALSEYLECLRKSVDDACEESGSSRRCRKTPIERWKAEGEAQALASCCTVLAQLVEKHAPMVDPYPLSINGENLELGLVVFRLGVDSLV